MTAHTSNYFPTSADHLRRVAARVAQGLPVTAGDAAWCVHRVREYVKGAHQGATLDQCFGVELAAGQEPWWCAAFRDARDTEMRSLAAFLLPAGNLGDREDAVRRAVRKFEIRWQRSDRSLAEMPARYRGCQDEFLFRAFKAAANLSAGDGSAAVLPTGSTQLRKILSLCTDKQTDIAQTPPFQRYR